ncbi:MAG: hypothetical protein CM15mP111_4910 [Hyphomicrobiales bacterium]|nr:MAG: hypothetical protein CM15mP111_4910 [Hyphomicrobiales bacterium]
MIFSLPTKKGGQPYSDRPRYHVAEGWAINLINFYDIIHNANPQFNHIVLIWSLTYRLSSFFNRNKLLLADITQNSLKSFFFDLSRYTEVQIYPQ